MTADIRPSYASPNGSIDPSEPPEVPKTDTANHNDTADSDISVADMPESDMPEIEVSEIEVSEIEVSEIEVSESAVSETDAATLNVNPLDNKRDNQLDDQLDKEIHPEGHDSDVGERYAPEKIQVTQGSETGLLQWFYDLPVADKQLTGLLASKILSVLGVIGISLWLLLMTGRRQISAQAVSELSAMATDLTHGSPVDSVGGGADDILIETADRYLEDGESVDFLDDRLLEGARSLLRSKLRAAQLESITLVGTDTRAIVSGGADRSGEPFNPDNLVASALRQGQPKTAISLLTVAELQALGIRLPSSADESALVKLGVVPLFTGDNFEEDAVARGTVIGALVTGEVLNDGSPWVASALTQFSSGYSALYRQDPSGGFELIESVQAQGEQAEPALSAPTIEAQNLEQSYNYDFLAKVVGASPEVVHERFKLPNGAYYTAAAKAVTDHSGEPVGVVLRSLPEQSVLAMLQRDMWLIIGAALTALLVDVIIAQLLGRSIVKPVRNLQVATEKFAAGDRTVRADVFARDEVGRVASAFNELAAAVASSESSLKSQSQSQSESARKAQLLSEFTSQIRQTLDVDTILATAVARSRSLLQVDRVLVYRFAAGYGGGDVTAESVAKGWRRALGEHLEAPMRPNSVARFLKGEVFFAQDIETANTKTANIETNIEMGDLSESHRRLLRELDVKANMIAPIIVGDDLVGLLCAHQCSGPRQWQPAEIAMMQQLSTQVGYALAQSKLLHTQRQAVKREQQLMGLVTSIRETSDREKIFRIITRQVKLALETSRVLIYTFDEQWHGTIVAESVDAQWPPALGAEITDPCFADKYVEQYKTGRVKATADIYQADLTPCHLEQLEPFKVRANIVAPIVVNEHLLGLLIAHECEGPREWSEPTINFMQRAATQLGFALEQADANSQKEQALAQAKALSQERLQRQERLQQQLLNLLDDVEAAADGNLTVRADVSAGEIGTVADFFNSIVENLRQIVTQVKQSAHQVTDSLGQNEAAIQALAEEALQQAEQTTLTLDSVENMTASIQQVAHQAQEAAAVAKAASATATVGEEAMDLTVSNIMALRQTVGQTAKKVKRLGESSQQITKAVMLINQIAQQTNLLAINAGIEAARAGEAGQGFAVVAEEVGELATRSASATEEIERIVETIQRETNDVVEAIEKSTAQVVEGTRRVEDAKLSLSQILTGSQQMDELARMISEATGSQVEISAVVSTLMAEIAQLSARTSDSSRQVSEALQQTVSVAQNLQDQVATFVVEEG
ncbi:MAG: GAF domain-containing protein [Phormidesmis sp. RL_2_1]|nr:GAF domain-containing protein [Phormidesmis sp. RL_2_1]